MGNDPKSRFFLPTSCHTNPFGDCSNDSLSVPRHFRVFYGVPKLPRQTAITEIRLPWGSCGIRRVSSICWVKSWVTAFGGNSPKVSDSRSSQGICWVKRCLEQESREQPNSGNSTNSSGTWFGSRKTAVPGRLLVIVLGHSGQL